MTTTPTPATRAPSPSQGDSQRGARRLVRAFVVVAVVEAFTWAGLLAGMYVKYVLDGSHLGVRVFGSLHGAAFIVYGLLTLLTARAQRWGVWPTLFALAAAVPPFATVVFEVIARRRGLLDVPARS